MFKSSKNFSISPSSVPSLTSTGCELVEPLLLLLLLLPASEDEEEEGAEEDGASLLLSLEIGEDVDESSPP